MPGGDGTGPMGMGPMTGRGAGYCAGYGAPGFANPWPRMGRGRGFWRRGFGRGFGWRRWAAPIAPVEPVFEPAYSAQPYPQQTKEQEIQYLEQEAEAIAEEQRALSQELENIKKRIEELKK